MGAERGGVISAPAEGNGGGNGTDPLRWASQRSGTSAALAVAVPVSTTSSGDEEGMGHDVRASVLKLGRDGRGRQ